MFVKYLKIMLAVCGFLGAIEICARIDDSLAFSAPFFAKYNSDQLRAYDMDGLPINVPNSRFEKWEHNSYGFRGPEIEAYPPAGTTRIICLGASETYGLHESPGKEWPAQLQTLLPYSEYQVVNASRAGLGFNSIENYVEKYVLPIHPDKIILLINPYFYFDNLEKTRSEKRASKRLGSVTEVHSLNQMIIENCRSLPKIKATVKAAFSSNFPTILERYQTWNLLRQLKSLEVVRLKDTLARDQVPHEYIDRLRKDLTSLIMAIKQKKIEVILCTYPSIVNQENINNYPVTLLDLRRFFPQYSLKGLVSAVDSFNDTASNVAMSFNIKIVDGAKAVPKTKEYFGDAVHYTDRGAYMIATAVSRLIYPEHGSYGELLVQGKVK